MVECFGSGHSSNALLGNWDGVCNCSNPFAFLPFTGTCTMGAVAVPTHPILAGVHSFSTSSNAYDNAGPPAYSLSGDGALMIQNAVAFVGPAPPSGPQLALQGTCGQAGLDQINLAGAASADANGDASFVGPGNRVPASACGTVSLQAADVATCAVTNVLTL